ncbi:MAG: response regulator [Proteobacteria bacterium]|nr:response regulator [Pseudomonadota bacterium]
MDSQLRKRILICDDDRAFLAVLVESLNARGYEPTTAAKGKEALDRFARLSPDLVLLDYRLPDMDGGQVLQKLRTAEARIPIILMTGFGDQKVAAELMKSGAMDYLVKPFQMGELLESIENTLRKADEIKRRQEQEKLILWGKLFPFVAHEIRNPLHSIGGAVALIKKRCQNDETTARAVKIIQEEIMRLNHFMNQCLDFSRPSSKEGFSSINLNEVVKSCLQLMVPFLRSVAKRIDVEAKLEPSLPLVYAHGDQIKQVLINLLRNATEAIKKEGEIIVETHHKRERSHALAEIKVIDTGVGIREEDLAKVFTPFFSRKRQGIGLGLAVSKKLVEENHHGHIRMDSRPSKGTTITVTLPIGSPDSANDRPDPSQHSRASLGPLPDEC